MIVKVVQNLGYSVACVYTRDVDDGREHLERMFQWPVLKEKNSKSLMPRLLKREEEWGLLDALVNT